MVHKEKYRELCINEKSIPIFSQAWWLDAVAGENWDVCLIEKGGEVYASMPYFMTKRYGLVSLSQPKLTQNLGPWIKLSAMKYSKQLSQQKDLMEDLINQLPVYHIFNQNWDCSQTNWLPFYWNGFEQTTRYTYRLSLKIGKEQLWENLQDNIRREIRKAKERFKIQVREGTLDEFLNLNSLTFERQNRRVPYDREFVRNIDKAASARSARDCLVAVDKEGNLHAGVYIVRSGDTAYYLMGGGNPELRNSGATSLVMWEAICQQPNSIEVFDFEGSMIEPIERFFRAFGAIQTPYFSISKTNSKLVRLYRTFRDLKKIFKN